MKRKFENRQYLLPSSWASYLINADASGLSDEEVSDCDFFCSTNGVSGGAVDCGESFFHYCNDFNKIGGNVCQFTFLIPIEAWQTEIVI